MLKVLAVLFVLGVFVAPLGLPFEGKPYLVDCWVRSTSGGKTWHVTGEIAFPRKWEVSFFTGRRPVLERIVPFDEVIETPDSSISTEDIFRVAKAKAQPSRGRWVFNWMTLPALGVMILVTAVLVWLAFFRKRADPTAG